MTSTTDTLTRSPKIVGIPLCEDTRASIVGAPAFPQQPCPPADNAYWATYHPLIVNAELVSFTEDHSDWHFDAATDDHQLDRDIEQEGGAGGRRL
ncbi:MAG: hypothetical protein WCL50_05860 [Spirochaetota bacterium]